MSMSGSSADPVILATAGYDHTIRFWQAHSGICHRTVQHNDSVSLCLCLCVCVCVCDCPVSDHPLLLIMDWAL